MKYKNNTGGLSKVGYVAKVDSRDPRAFVYAPPDETNVLGIITEAVPRGKLCEIKTTGTVNVFIAEKTVPGAIIRSKKSADSFSWGQAKSAVSSDVPYFKIGTAINSGSGLVLVDLNLQYVGTIGGGVYDVFTESTDGLVPKPTASTGKYLKDDATWDSPLMDGYIDGGSSDTVYGGIDPIEGGSA